MFHPQTIPVAEPVAVSDHVPVTDLFAFLTHSCSCTCSVFETITVPVPIPVPETGLLKQWWNQAVSVTFENFRKEKTSDHSSIEVVRLIVSNVWLPFQNGTISTLI